MTGVRSVEDDAVSRTPTYRRRGIPPEGFLYDGFDIRQTTLGTIFECRKTRSASNGINFSLGSSLHFGMERHGEKERKEGRDALQTKINERKG